MSVIETSIRRPVTVIICTLAIIFFGLYVYTQMPQQKRPDTDFPMVTVTTTMSGANASVMDNDVADVLEEKLNGISGVNTISSSSYQGGCVTTIEFKMDNPVEILSSPLDEMIDMYIKECLEKMGFPSYFLAERLNVDEKIKVVKYLQEKGTFKVKGAIVLVAEKLAVSEPTVYRYLKKNV